MFFPVDITIVVVQDDEALDGIAVQSVLKCSCFYDLYLKHTPC